MNTKLLRVVALIAATLATTTTRAGVTVGKDIEQTADVKNSPISSVATGSNSKASATVNSIEDATVGGSIKQIANIKNSPVTAIAVGSGAKARSSVNSIGPVSY